MRDGEVKPIKCDLSHHNVANGNNSCVYAIYDKVNSWCNQFIPTASIYPSHLQSESAYFPPRPT